MLRQANIPASGPRRRPAPGGVALLLAVALAVPARAEDIAFPADAGVVDVTAAPYLAKGDGARDDTAAIQQALADHPNRGAIIYLPKGTYLVSDTLRWPHGDRGGWEEKNTILQGQSTAGAVLKLKDGCPGYADPAQPKAVIWTGQAPAQRFRNALRNLTIDTGSGNPGAVGAQFMANNQGCVRDVAIRAGDGRGVVGLDLGYTDENGPLLVSHVRVSGFDVGIRAATAVDSETLEHVTLEGQRRCGLENGGQCLSIRGLASTNAVPAVSNAGSGLVVLIDSTLEGVGAAATAPAIDNRAALFARNVKTRGYARAIRAEADAAPPPVGPDVAEYASTPALGRFPNPGRSLGLPIRETPQVPWDAPGGWASPLAFGGKPDDDRDDAAAIQKAIDSGKPTVYLPRGNWKVADTVLIRGAVRRLIGCEAYVDAAPMDKPAFRVAEGSAPVVIVERLSGGYARTPFFANASGRTLVISSCCNVCGTFAGPGDVFIEDVCSNPFTSWSFKNRNVWARQFNVENEGTHVANDGAALWVLGLKTERGGTLVETAGGGKTEVLGGLCYTTTAGSLAPMFVIRDAAFSATIGESCFNGDPYTTLVRETHAGRTEVLKRGEAPGRTGGSLLPLYAGGPENPPR